MAESKIGEVVTQAATGLGSLPIARQIGLLVGLAGSIALGIYAVQWAMEPNFRPLYANLDQRETANVMDVLQRSGIVYKIDSNTGQVMVPTDAINQARLKLAQEGLPKGEGESQLFDKNSAFGSSQFMESMRYLHEIEIELSRSIMAMDHVKQARVHLAVPKQTAFTVDERKPSASVLVDVYAGSELSRQQVSAIVNLVASSVPELTADHVTLVDERGRLLNDGGGTSEMGLADKRFDYQQAIEESYAKQVVNLITPILGAGKVRAEVSVDLDFTRLDQTQELYNTEDPALRSEQKIEEQRGGGKSAPPEGTPGALSNQAPPEPQLSPKKPETTPGSTTPTNTTAENKASNTGDSRTQLTRNFELDKTINYIRKQPGQIRKLSVAVLLDDKTSVDKSGKVKRTPLKPEEIAEITKLVRDAVGFEAERGDRVTVVNRSFADPEPVEAVPEPGFFEKGWVQNLLKQLVGGGFVLFILLGVLKPMMRHLASRALEYRNGGVTRIIGADGVVREIEGNASNLDMDELKLSGPQQSYEEQMQSVKKLATSDPKRVAHIVKKWVDGEG